MTSHRLDEKEISSTTVMVIDDNAFVRDILARELILAGHQVRTAASGAEALGQLQSHPVDLVLLDINLPDVSGAELLPAIKQLPDAPGVIILTAHSALDPAFETLERDVLGVLTKPCSFDELCRSVNRGLGHLQAVG